MEEFQINSHLALWVEICTEMQQPSSSGCSPIRPTFYALTLFSLSLVCVCVCVCSLPQVLECGEEKVLCLTEVERVKALAAQLVKLLRAQRDCRLPVQQLLAEYSKTFGYGLRLQDYDANS